MDACPDSTPLDDPQAAPEVPGASGPWLGYLVMAAALALMLVA